MMKLQIQNFIKISRKIISISVKEDIWWCMTAVNFLNNDFIKTLVNLLCGDGGGELGWAYFLRALGTNI